MTRLPCAKSMLRSLWTCRAPTEGSTRCSRTFPGETGGGGHIPATRCPERVEISTAASNRVSQGDAQHAAAAIDAALDGADGAAADFRNFLVGEAAGPDQELAATKQRLDALTSPRRPEEKTPTGKPTEDMQRIACVVSGGQWVNGKCEKKSAGGAEKDTTGAQLAVVKAQAESEFKVLKEGLDLQKSALDRALDDRLVSIRDYYARKTQIEQQAIDQELAAKQQELTAQSAVAVNGKDEAQRLRAKAEVKKLEGEITVLNMKRGEVEVANAHAAAKAEKELADELARVRDRLAEIRGGTGGDVTRARLEREYQPLIEKLNRMGDTTGAADVGRLINVEADLAELARLERQYGVVTERMAIRERELQVQKDAGMLTESQMRRGVLELHQQTAAAQQQEAAESQHVGVHHPDQRGLGELQVIADGRQRHVDDRRVEDRHDHPDDQGGTHVVLQQYQPFDHTEADQERQQQPLGVAQRLAAVGQHCGRPQDQ